MKNEEYSEKKLRGFTLIELIVVITIIGILASIIVPTFVGYMETANNVADAENARIISSAIRAEAMDGTNLEVFRQEILRLLRSHQAHRLVHVPEHPRRGCLLGGESPEQPRAGHPAPGCHHAHRHPAHHGVQPAPPHARE